MSKDPFVSAAYLGTGPIQAWVFSYRSGAVRVLSRTKQ